MKNKIICSFICLFGFTQLLAQQLIYTTPDFPVVADDVTITWDASQGNGGLENYGGDIWVHTGVITQNSESPTDWQYVFANWDVNKDAAKMVPQYNNIYTLEFNIRNFYGIPDGEIVEQLAFVFRNDDGSLQGKTADGSDIYTPVYQADQLVAVNITYPSEDIYLANEGEIIPFTGISSQDAELCLTDNGVIVASTFGNNLSYDLTAITGENHLIEFCAKDTSGNTACESFTYIVPGTPLPEDPPANLKLGINYIGEGTVSLKLHAPEKQFVYVIGSFNNWIPSDAYLMHRSLNNEDYWITLEDLTPGENYTFQYYVDGVIKIADPYSEVVLDPYHDAWISEETYPNLPAYPSEKTTGHVTLLQPGQAAYLWEVTDFQKPPKEELVIYELLLRDFLAAHDYKTLKDTLDYLERLGINAIELLPVNEFEGNDSWGYNPSFHMALDKYYGDKNSFKDFIDEAHKRGIAVILDVVYNHAFSQSPLCQLYWDAANFRPADNNPWANPVAKHPFNVGYDLNHESQATKDFVDRNVTYWLEEFNIDGFRFDLSKGFTQVDYGVDVGAWSSYDASRIALLKRIADVVWEVSLGAYVILEHLSENSEEKKLADCGMMLWGNMNYNFNEATMGYSNNNITGASYKSRNWDAPHLIAYMESHDEERLMFKNMEYGNSDGDYNVKDFQTALRRNELATVFYYAIPGPKMLWQFGEMGYDYAINYCIEDGSIEEGCRTGPKPILWNYLDDPDRERLFLVTQAMIHLKKNYPAFRDYNASMGGIGSGALKSIQLNHPDMDINVLGNFGVTNSNIDPSFSYTGNWYEYFTGDTLDVTNVNEEIALNPGVYKLYTSVKLDPPPGGYELFYTEEIITEPEPDADFQLSPNPNDGIFTVAFQLDKASETDLRIFNAAGSLVYRKSETLDSAGAYKWEVSSSLPYGVYIAYLTRGEETNVSKFIVGR